MANRRQVILSSTRSDARPELYSYGHRNVQGLAMHPVTGDLWENELGPRGGDEVNMIEPGKNYGWPTITYGLEYSGEKVGRRHYTARRHGAAGLLLGSGGFAKWDDFLQQRQHTGVEK